MVLAKYVVEEVRKDDIGSTLRRIGEGVVGEVPELSGAQYIGGRDLLGPRFREHLDVGRVRYADDVQMRFPPDEESALITYGPIGGVGRGLNVGEPEARRSLEEALDMGIQPENGRLRRLDILEERLSRLVPLGQTNVEKRIVAPCLPGVVTSHLLHGDVGREVAAQGGELPRVALAFRLVEYEHFLPGMNQVRTLQLVPRHLFLEERRIVDLKALGTPLERGSEARFEVLGAYLYLSRVAELQVRDDD